MTRFGWLAMVVCTGILALTITLFITIEGTSAADEDGTVSIRGVGNSGNTFYAAPTAHRLSRLLKVERDIPLVSDDELRLVVAAVRERALAGDAHAAHFIVDLAAAQRRAAAAAVPATAAPPGK
jgi:hypothetical protein